MQSIPSQYSTNTYGNKGNLCYIHVLWFRWLISHQSSVPTCQPITVVLCGSRSGVAEEHSSDEQTHHLRRTVHMIQLTCHSNTPGSREEDGATHSTRLGRFVALRLAVNGNPSDSSWSGLTVTASNCFFQTTHLAILCPLDDVLILTAGSVVEHRD